MSRRWWPSASCRPPVMSSVAGSWCIWTTREEANTEPPQIWVVCTFDISALAKQQAVADRHGWADWGREGVSGVSRPPCQIKNNTHTLTWIWIHAISTMTCKVRQAARAPGELNVFIYRESSFNRIVCALVWRHLSAYKGQRRQRRHDRTKLEALSLTLQFIFITAVAFFFFFLSPSWLSISISALGCLIFSRALN